MPQFTEMRPPELWPAHEARHEMQPIVVGYDGSAAARRGLGRAASLAGAGGRVVVVAAMPMADDRLHEHDPAAPMRRERDAWLREASARLAGHDLHVSIWAAEAEPAEALAEIAHASGAQLIVVGARGDSFLARAVRGSVAEKLVSRAPCDVLVVR